MAETKSLEKESFLLIRFESANSTKIIDFKQNNIDEIQMIAVANMLELMAKKVMMDSMASLAPEVAPPKILTPNG